MDSEVSVSLSERSQEKEVPEKNALDYFDGLFYVLGAVTRASRHDGIERPLALRTERAQLYKKIRRAQDREEKLRLVSEAQERDRIFKQYLQQGEVRVKLGELGEQAARYVEMDPHGSENEQTPEPPVVIVAGASNDIDCVGALARELPLKGRRTFVLGYPESYLGKVTPEFVEAVKSSPTYEPHSEFYKQAITRLLPEGNFELWGYSNGGPISALMLNDKEFSERVTDAVLVSPASVVDQDMDEFVRGTANEFRGVFGKFKDLPRYTLSIGIKGEEDQTHGDLRKEVFGTLLNRVLTRMDAWKEARVREGGTITVVAPLRDNMTRCYQVFNQGNEDQLRQDNSQIRVLNIEGTHVTALINPAPVIEKVKAVQNS